MKVNISDIVKADGASLNVEFNDYIEDFVPEDNHFVFKEPVQFKGRLTNNGGVIRLSGELKTGYVSSCYRCLKDLQGEIDIPIEEDFIHAEKSTDSEAYTYEGNNIILDKALKDNILLNLPMKQLCDEECKGLCPQCGADLNNGSCSCVEDDIDPRMEALKNFFSK